MFCPKCGIENPDNGKFCRGCGASLANVLAVLNGKISDEKAIFVKNELAELYSTGIRNTILGAGFLVTSIFLFTIPGDTFFWLLMMIPAFCLIASGVSRIIKADVLKTKGKIETVESNALSQKKSQKELTPTKTDYIKPQNTIYETDNLSGQPISVTEDTTRHLQMNTEG